MHVSTAAILTILAGVANCHMILALPKPFLSVKPDDNGPLNGTGQSNYPCKYSAGVDKNSFYSFDTRTKLTPGQPSNLTFTGSAVHGGGSCQLSLTKDLQPTRDSVFKVIHSIEGGCPARTAPGNLNGDKDTPDPDKYPFTVPVGIEPGQYTFAWSWFNHMGNREMYMNCAPVEVMGGGGKAKRDGSFFDSLPDIFLANIPDVDCKSSDGGSSSISFPNPGKSVDRLPVIVEPKKLTAPLGDVSKCYGPPGGSSSSGSQTSDPSTQDSGSGGGSPAAAASSVAATSSLAISPVYTPPPQPNMNQVAPFPQSNSSTASVSAPAPSASSGASSGSTSSSSGSSGSGSCPSTAVPCTNPGSIVCVSTTQFGLCDINNCAIVQAVAAGTTCSNGIISKRNEYAIPAMSHRRRRGMHPHVRSPYHYVPHQ